MKYQSKHKMIQITDLWRKAPWTLKRDNIFTHLRKCPQWKKVKTFSFMEKWHVSTSSCSSAQQTKIGKTPTKTDIYASAKATNQKLNGILTRTITLWHSQKCSKQMQLDSVWWNRNKTKQAAISQSSDTWLLHWALDNLWKMEAVFITDRTCPGTGTCREDDFFIL